MPVRYLTLKVYITRGHKNNEPWDKFDTEDIIRRVGRAPCNFRKSCATRYKNLNRETMVWQYCYRYDGYTDSKDV